MEPGSIDGGAGATKTTSKNRVESEGSRGGRGSGGKAIILALLNESPLVFFKQRHPFVFLTLFAPTLLRVVAVAAAEEAEVVEVEASVEEARILRSQRRGVFIERLGETITTAKYMESHRRDAITYFCSPRRPSFKR